MSRASATLASCLLVCSAAAQATAQVTVTLSLDGDRHSFKVGEAILLHLTYTATEPGFSLNTTITEPASPIDDLAVSPMGGVFPWLDDKAHGNRYTPDYEALSALENGKAQTVTLPLNAVYRFETAGHYTVQIVSHRVSVGGVQSPKPFGPLVSNPVDFQIEPMSDAEDASRALALERKIRKAADLRTAQQYGEELDWLTEDASTRVKLSLLLHPKEFYPFGIDLSRGLWIARNRTLVVAELERALRDPAQPLSAGSSLLELAVSLKARLESPFDSAYPTTPLETQRIKAEYLKQIADSLPKREGEALVDAARTIFLELARKGEIGTPEFATAREVLIMHFAEVNEFNVDWLLNSYGAYLQDMRMVPALEQILKTQHNPILNAERTAVLKQLLKITRADGREELIAEVCGENPTLLQAVDEAPFESLPETDDCLKRKIHAAADPVKQFELDWVTEFAARFASSTIYDDLLALYRKSGATWDKQAQGYMLGYLVHWNAHRALPLLESALPANAPTLDFNILYALNRAYSPPLGLFWRERLSNAFPEQAGRAAWLLSENGTVEDQTILRARLERWRAEWTGHKIPESEARLETDLMEAVTRGKNWQTPETEVAGLGGACLSSACKSRFSVKR